MKFAEVITSLPYLNSLLKMVNCTQLSLYDVKFISKLDASISYFSTYAGTEERKMHRYKKIKK